jgi:hypothetical protein
MHETKYSSLSSVEGKYLSAYISSATYPAMRRPIDNLPKGSDRVFIPTGGNALQAVSREVLEQNGLMAVSVPASSLPGNKLLVRAPDGSDRVISAVVPKGAFPGHTFLVRIPAEEAVPVCVMGIPVQADLAEQKHRNHERAGVGDAQVVAGRDIESADLRLVEESSPTEHLHNVSHQQPSSELELQDRRNTRSTPETSDPNVVLIKVPRGASPGTKFRVRVPDGRTVDATVPPGNVQEFYLRLPTRKQNWHDNPLAVAPMVFGPLFL